MSHPEPIHLGDGLTLWVLSHPVLGLRTSLGCPVTYCSRAQAEHALEREVERQRRDGWIAVRVELRPSECGLCGETMTTEHECRRDEG